VPADDQVTSLTGSDGSAQNGAVVFATTHWSVVLTAQGESPAAQEALEKLCRIYWWPLYGFVRRQSKLWQFQAVSVLGSIARRSALRKNRRLPRAQVTLRSALPALSEAERVEWGGSPKHSVHDIRFLSVTADNSAVPQI